VNRLFTLVFAFALGLCPASAQFAQSPPFGAGQTPGTVTNDNATAGKVGEYAESVVTAATATITVTIAAPAVVTWTGHPYSSPTSGIVATGAINFTTTGALPTGLVAGTNYYATVIDANTLHLSTTVANALAGTYITTTGSQSGVQTGVAEALLSTGAGIDMAGLALTAGDWSCRANIGLDPAGSTVTTNFTGWINTASVTAPGVATRGAYALLAFTEPTGAIEQMFLGVQRYLLSSTTNVFLTGSATFSVSTNKGYGLMACQRNR
jgi:hypothetical protein